MKKYIIPLILIFTFCGMAFAQDLNKMVSDYSKYKGAELETVPKSMLDLGLSEKAKDSYLSKVTSIETLDLSDCSDFVKKKFIEEFNSLKDGNGYKILFKERDEDEEVTVIMRKEKGLIKNIFIVETDRDVINNSIDDIDIVKISGNFSESDLQNIIESRGI